MAGAHGGIPCDVSADADGAYPAHGRADVGQGHACVRGCVPLQAWVHAGARGVRHRVGGHAHVPARRVRAHGHGTQLSAPSKPETIEGHST